MKYYLAPMEGITGYVYRNAYQKCFHNVDKYFTPFISPHQNKGLTTKEYNDCLPEHNVGIPLIPQILTKDANDFIRIAQILKDFGYKEINLNLGCPSPTVVTKGKGSGFLGKPQELREFLTKIYEMPGIEISVKSRLGIAEPEEFLTIMEIYNDFPIKELILHPRVQKDLYKNTPNLAMFEYAMSKHNMPVVYNGDLFTGEDVMNFSQVCPQVTTVMLGRGVIRNPELIDEIEHLPNDGEVLQRFHDLVLEGYQNTALDERSVLFRMKELWSYMITCFPDEPKALKKILKSSAYKEYIAITNALFQSQRNHIL